MLPNQQRRANNGSVLHMIQTLDICATNSQDDDAALLLGMAAKALAQLQSHSDKVRAEAVNWKVKCEQMGQLSQELEDKNDDLSMENGQLLLKIQQLEVHEQMVGLADKNEQLGCEFVPDKVLIEASPKQDTTTTDTRPRSFSGDVYKQLDEFELSIDMELDDFQRLGLLYSDEIKKNIKAKNSEDGAEPASESEQTSSSCLVAESPCEMVMSGAPRRNPLHLLQRMFQTQDDDPMPAMTTSDSLFSRSSDYSLSTRSTTSNFRSSGPTKRSTKMSPHSNAEWAIIE
jgi:hypothetical protein